MPPGGEMFDLLSISAKTHRVRGRVKTLPYSKNETCTKPSNNNLSFQNRPFCAQKRRRPKPAPMLVKSG